MISTVDDFLDPIDLEYYSNYVQSRNMTQKVLNDPETTQKFWERYGEAITQIVPGSRICPSVTVTHTNTPIRRHTDVNHHGERCKILIYLNNVSDGGTIFYPSGVPEIVIENRANRLVVFDMDIAHESQNFTHSNSYRQKKIAIGFRLM
jgi:hypothetical protein